MQFPATGRRTAPDTPTGSARRTGGNRPLGYVNTSAPAKKIDKTRPNKPQTGTKICAERRKT